MKHEPPQTFTFTAPGSRLKVECLIYQTGAAMVRQARKLSGDNPNINKSTGAYTETDLELIPKGHLAIIFFNRKDWTYGILAHEMSHAANGFLSRKHIDWIRCTTKIATTGEERHADIMGNLVDAFLKKYEPHT